jgi:hypothetical protein
VFTVCGWLAEDGDRWRAVVITVLNFLFFFVYIFYFFIFIIILVFRRTCGMTRSDQGITPFFRKGYTVCSLSVLHSSLEVNGGTVGMLQHVATGGAM